MKDEKCPSRTKDESEIFERVLDTQIDIAGGLKLGIKISITSLDKARESGMDFGFPDSTLKTGDQGDVRTGLEQIEERLDFIEEQLNE